MLRSLFPTFHNRTLDSSVTHLFDPLSHLFKVLLTVSRRGMFHGFKRLPLEPQVYQVIQKYPVPKVHINLLTFHVVHTSQLFDLRCPRNRKNRLGAKRMQVPQRPKITVSLLHLYPHRHNLEEKSPQTSRNPFLHLSKRLLLVNPKRSSHMAGLGSERDWLGVFLSM